MLEQFSKITVSQIFGCFYEGWKNHYPADSTIQLSYNQPGKCVSRGALARRFLYQLATSFKPDVPENFRWSRQRCKTQLPSASLYASSSPMARSTPHTARGIWSWTNAGSRWNSTSVPSCPRSGQRRNCPRTTACRWRRMCTSRLPEVRWGYQADQCLHQSSKGDPALSPTTGPASVRGSIELESVIGIKIFKRTVQRRPRRG